METANANVGELTPAERQQLDSWLEEFERTWAEGCLAARMAQLPAQGPVRVVALREFVKVDLRRQWQRGRRVTLDSYLLAHPELGSTDTVALDLIQAELKARRQAGDPASWKEYTERFPKQTQDMQRWLEQQMQNAPADETRIEPSLAEAAQQAVLGTLKPGSTDPSVYDAPSHPTKSTPPKSEVSASGPVHQTPMPEQQLGRYHIRKYLGGGAMGKVYLAQDTQLDRQVAMKIPFIKPDDSPEIMTRFYREAKAAATLHHPNICPVYDVGEIDSVPYLTMAYIEGPTLTEVLRKDGPLPQQEAAQVVRKLALALEEAHQRGVVHRDLKPSNIMMARGVGPVIMDFGLALRTDQDLRITNPGSVLGTPAYMSPEQVRGDIKLMGPCCDVYSLGVILYELLTGKLPFMGPMTEVLVRIVTEKPDPPSTHRAELDPLLEAICLKAIAAQVSNRYRSMADFAAALAEYLQTSTQLSGNYAVAADAAKRDAPDTYADMALDQGRPRTKRRFVAALIALVVVGGLAVGGFVWLPSLLGPPAPPLPPPATDFEVHVTSKPADAEVYVNGIKQPHLTPTKIKLPEGKHDFQLRLLGYKTWEQGFTIDSERKGPFHHDFVPLFQTITIRTTPKDARIYLGKQQMKPGANGTYELPVGEHMVRAEAAGHLTRERKVTVQPDRKDQVFAFELHPFRKLALLVGVDQPTKELPDFLHAADDIRTLEHTLKACDYDRVVVPAPATAPQIRGQLKELLDKCTEADTVLVALVGHVLQRGAECHFCPEQTNLKDDKTLLRLDELYDDLQGSPAQHKILLIDGWRKQWQQVKADPTQARPARVVVPDRVLLVLSCGAGERGWDHPDLRHGLFMHAIIQGLRGGADADKDQQVTWSELKTYVQDELAKHKTELAKHGKPQTPEFIGEPHNDRATLVRVPLATVTFQHGCELLADAARETDDKKRRALLLEEAMQSFTAVEKELSGLPELHLKRAMVSYYRKDYDRARDECEAALKIDPDNAAAHSLLAESLLAQHSDSDEFLKHSDTILKHNDKAIQRQPNYAPAHSLRGQTYYNLYLYHSNPKPNETKKERQIREMAAAESWRMAVADFERAIKLKPIQKHFYYYLASAYVAEKQFDKAIEESSRAIELDVRYVDALVLRGHAYYYQSSYADAVDDYDAAIKAIKRLEPDLHFYRGRALFEQGKFKEALPDYLIVAKKEPKNHQAWFYAGVSAWEVEKNNKRDPEPALAYLNEAIALSKTFAAAYYERGRVYFESEKDIPQAIKDFTKVVEDLDKQHIKAWEFRGKAHAARGNKKQAEADQKMADKLREEALKKKNDGAPGTQPASADRLLAPAYVAIPCLSACARTFSMSRRIWRSEMPSFSAISTSV